MSPFIVIFMFKYLNMKALLLVLLTLSCGILQAQKIQYDVILMGKKIGNMEVVKSNGDFGERYIVQSESSAKVLFVKQDSKVSFDVLYKSGSLVNSLYVSEKKDDNIITKVNKHNNIYKVLFNDKSHQVQEQIQFSSVMLYFKEPVGIQKIFVERLGNFLPIVKSGPGQYEYLQPDGTKSIYRYTQGKLKEVELKRSMGSVFIRPA